MGTVEFVAVTNAGAEVGPFPDWLDALKAARDAAERDNTRACVWARWRGRHEIMLEVDAGAERVLRIFAPWSWRGVE